MKAGINKGIIRYAVWNQIDLIFGNTVDLLQEVPSTLAHHYKPV